jgi:hypothetical protein
VSGLKIEAKPQPQYKPTPRSAKQPKLKTYIPLPTWCCRKCSSPSPLCYTTPLIAYVLEASRSFRILHRDNSQLCWPCRSHIWHTILPFFFSLSAFTLGFLAPNVTTSYSPPPIQLLMLPPVKVKANQYFAFWILVYESWVVVDNSTVVGGSCEVCPSISIDKKWKAHTDSIS